MGEIEYTQEAFDAQIKLLHTMPHSVVSLFVNRATDPRACIAACDAILTEQPNCCMAYLYKGIVAEEAHDYAEALKNFTKVTEFVPLMWFGWQSRGRMELWHHDTIAARRSFTYAQRFGRTDGYTACLFAVTFYLEGNVAQTFEIVDTLIRDNVVDDPEYLVWFKGHIHEREGNTEEALLNYIEYQLMLNGNDDGKKAEIALKIFELTQETLLGGGAEDAS